MPSAHPIDKPFVSDDRVISFDPWIVVAFLFPLTKLVTIKLGGTLFGQDVLGVALFLFFIVQKDGITRLNQIWPVLTLLVSWFLSQVITDLYRGTPVEDYSRGWLKIIMFGFQITALWLFLSRRSSYVAAFALGQAISLVGMYPTLVETYGYQFWKFGVGEGIGLFVAAIFSGVLPGTAWLKRYAWIALGACAFLMLFLGYRSGFGALIVAAGLCFAVNTLNRLPALRARFNGPMFALVLLGGLASSQLIFSIYGYFASSGALGVEAQDKYELQTQGEVPIILGGRVESLVSTEAIAESPIIGHGSWAKSMYYQRLLRVKMREYGIRLIGDKAFRNDLIPTHSYIFGAWVEAGVIGAVFWLYVIAYCIMTVYKLFKYNLEFFPLVSLMSVSLLWAVWFSPFGAEARFSASLTIVVMLLIRRATDRVATPANT